MATAPGVHRPYTLVDILGTLNGGIQDNSQGTTTITGTSPIGEADENSIVSEASVTGTVTTNLGWGQATWGTFAWS